MIDTFIQCIQVFPNTDSVVEAIKNYDEIEFIKRLERVESIPGAVKPLFVGMYKSNFGIIENDDQCLSIIKRMKMKETEERMIEIYDKMEKFIAEGEGELPEFELLLEKYPEDLNLFRIIEYITKNTELI